MAHLINLLIDVALAIDVMVVAHGHSDAQATMLAGAVLLLARRPR